MYRRRHRRARVICAAALAALPSTFAHAATDNWQGGSATTPTWDQGANWDLGAKPTAADDAVFPSGIPATPGATIGLGTGENAKSLAFNDSYTLGTAAGTGDLTLATSGVSVAAAKTASIASQLKGSAGLALTGGGALALTNTTTATTNNTFARGINVSAASTLQFSVEAALGSATGNNITLDNGTLQSTATTGSATWASTRIINIGAGGGTLTTAGTGTSGKIGIAGTQLTGSGTFTKTGGGDLQITSNSTFSGTFNVGGLVEASTNAALGTGAVNVNSGGELALGNSTTALANSITLNTGGALSSIGGGGAGISGPVNVAGNASIILRAFNSTTTGNNLTISGPLSGSGGLTTVAPTAGGTASTLLLNGNNAAYSGAIAAVAGTAVSFGTANSKGGATLSVTSSGTALGGVGVGYVPADQASLPSIDTNATGTFGGVFEVNTAAFNVALDLNTLYGTSSSPTGGSAGKWFLGSATATGAYTAATLGVSSDANYRLGGGGGTLTLSNPVLTGANNLIVGAASAINGGGTVALGALANSFSGTVTVANGTLSVSNVDNGGSNSPLGSGTSAINLTTGGTLLFTGPTDSTDRGIAVGTGGGTVNVSTAGTTLSVGPLSGTGTLIKSGSGALTLPGPANTVGGLNVSAGTVNVNGATSNALGAVTVASGATLNVNNPATATTLTTTAGTINANANLTFSGAAALNAAGGTTTINTGAASAVTVNAAVTIGNATNSGSVTLGANSSLVMNAPAANFVIGNRTAANGNLINDTFNGAAARNVSITAAVLQVGTTSGNPDNTNATAPLVTFTLPTGAASTSTITAATSILVGFGETTGLSNPTAVFNLGGGTNTITAPLISLGEEKQGATFGFQAGSAGSLVLAATGGGKTNLVIGENALVGTGTNPLSTMNLTTTGTVNATLGNITLAQSSATTTNGGAKGTFTLGAAGAGSLVTADSVTMAVSTGNSATLLTGTFNLTAGTFRFNAGGTGFVQGSGTAGSRTTAINVSGGLLDMNGKPITAVTPGTGTSTLALTGGVIANASSIGNFNTFTFTGGTLRDAGSIARAVLQSGATTRLEVTSALTGAGTTISGDYSLVGGAASVAAGKTLTVNGNLALDPTAGGFLGVDLAGAASGQYVATGTIGLTGTTADALDLTAPAGVAGQTVYTIAQFSGYAAGDADFETVRVNGFGAQDTNPAGANYVLVTYNPTNIQITVANVAATGVPEPTTLGLAGLGALGLLARRRRRRRA